MVVSKGDVKGGVKVNQCGGAMDGYNGTPAVSSALRLFVRPGELRKAEWAHIEQDRAEWRYTVTKTNTPLSSLSPGRSSKSYVNFNPSQGTGALSFRAREAIREL